MVNQIFVIVCCRPRFSQLHAMRSSMSLCIKRRWVILGLATLLAAFLMLMQMPQFNRIFYQLFFKRSTHNMNKTHRVLAMDSQPLSKNSTNSSFGVKPESKPRHVGIHWVNPSPTTHSCHASSCTVPRIVHIIWFTPDDPDFKFVHSASMLSIQRFIEPNRIVFWHDDEPTGTWWKFIRMHIPNLELRKCVPPSQVFGNKIRSPEHQSDVARLQILIRYGGIYLDLDTIVLKSFENLMAYPVTMGAESPELLGNGIIVARPNATFLRIWYDQYRTFDDRLYNEHSVRLPMNLAREYPKLVHIEWDSLLRPNWFERQWLIGEGKLWDWFNNYAIHLYLKYHKMEYSPQNIKFLNTTTGEILRYIYYGTYEIFKIKPK